MLVDGLQVEPTGDGRVRRSLRMRFDEGEEHACSVTVPEAFSPRDADDASGPAPGTAPTTAGGAGSACGRWPRCAR